MNRYQAEHTKVRRVVERKGYRVFVVVGAIAADTQPYQAHQPDKVRRKRRRAANRELRQTQVQGDEPRKPSSKARSLTYLTDLPIRTVGYETVCYAILAAETDEVKTGGNKEAVSDGLLTLDKERATRPKP